MANKYQTRRYTGGKSQVFYIGTLIGVGTALFETKQL